MPAQTSDIPFFNPSSPRYFNPTGNPEDVWWWQRFREFATTDFTAENLDFFTQTAGLDALYADPATSRGAVARLDNIIRNFVDLGAPNLINIDSTARSRFDAATTVQERFDAVMEMRNSILSLMQTNTLMRYESSRDFQRDAATYVDNEIGVNYWAPATSRPHSGPPRTTPASTHITDMIDHPRTTETPRVLTDPPPSSGHSGGSGGHGSTKDKDDKPTEERPREEPHPRK